MGSDPSGDIYLTGYTISADMPVTSNAPVVQWPGGINIFLTKLKPHVAGFSAYQYSTFFGGATINSALAISVGPDGTAYVVGSTGGELPTAPNATQAGFGGGASDGFLLIVTDSTQATQASRAERAVVRKRE